VQNSTQFELQFYKREFRLPAQCKWDMRCFGILRSVEWQFITDVSGQPIGVIFNGHPVLGMLYQWR